MPFHVCVSCSSLPAGAPAAGTGGAASLGRGHPAPPLNLPERRGAPLRLPKANPCPVLSPLLRLPRKSKSGEPDEALGGLQPRLTRALLF